MSRRRSPRSRRLVAAAILASVTPIIAGTGCRQIVGVEARVVAPRCSPAGVTYADGACGECTESECCSELDACKADASDRGCAEAFACLSACASTDEACRSACRDRLPADLGRPLAELLACQTRRCDEACHFTCGGYVASSAECASCFAANCCDAARACNANASCLSRRFCRSSCRDVACKVACNAADTDGALEDDALRGCQAKVCDTACAAWFCVLATPPIFQAKTITVALRVLDSTQLSKPVPGLRVKRCERPDLSCAFGVGPATTDADGIARFDVALAGSAVNGYFQIEDPSGLYVPEVVYPVPAISADATVSAYAITTRARDEAFKSLGVTRLGDRGIIIARTTDCLANDGAGVSYAITAGIDRETTGFYVRTFQFVRAGGSVGTTEAQGATGGFVNVLPGTTTISAKAALAMPLELMRPAQVINIRPDTVTYVDHALAR